MPLFDYRCNACGHTLELLSRTRDSTPERIPCDCGKGERERQVAAPVSHFKGDGWTRTGRDT